MLAAEIARADGPWHEGFEGPNVSWQAAGADMPYRIEAHGRFRGGAHSGEASEQIRVSGATGSVIYFSHPVPPARIAAELVPSVWIRADRPGLQILARVVLPHLIDPKTRQPTTVLIRTERQYTQVGVWEQLRIENTPLLLERQVRVLRRQLGHDVDPHEAYMDQVWLNVYGGPGVTNVAIDDLEVSGIISPNLNGGEMGAGGASVGNAGETFGREGGTVGRPATADGRPATADRRDGELGPHDVQGPYVAGTASGVARPSHDVRLDGSVLLVDGHPFFPRILRYRGESLTVVQKAGFNTVRTDQPPPPEMLADAERLGLWLICPPPRDPVASAGPTAPVVPPIGPGYDQVLAWHLGDGLTRQELSAVAALAKQVRLADTRRSRPIICGPETDLRAYSRYVDLLSFGRSPLGTTLELADYGAWLRERPRLARPGTPFWTTVQTELAPATRDQQTLFASPRAAIPADVESIRLLTYTALASGARGIEFQTEAPLDASPPTLILELALLNMELELAEPWAATGSYVTTATSSDAELQGAVLQTDKARLLLPMRIAVASQYIPRPAKPGPVSIVAPGVPESHNVYSLTPGGLQPIEHRRVTGGVQLTLEDFQLTALILITPDPVVINTLSRRAAQTAERAADLQRELTSRTLAECEAIDARLPHDAKDNPLAADYLLKARAATADADKQIVGGDPAAAFQAARRGMGPLEQFKRLRWEHTIRGQNSLAASPFIVAFDTLPDQFRLNDKLRMVGPGMNRLPGGDCENLPLMVQFGWRHVEHPNSEVRTLVELSPTQPHAGGSSLHLQVRAADIEAPPGLIETPPVWVTTPPVAVQNHELLAIHGWVRVPTAIRGSVDGLMILDSFGGEALAERVDHTPGWREFTLYRMATRDGPFSVTFALTGLGDAWIDDVTISPVTRLIGQELGQAPMYLRR